MTYKEYAVLESRYSHAISLKRQLLMTIRMNEAWQTNKNSIRGQKRQVKIDAAKEALAKLIVPPKPKQPTGFEVLDSEGDYVGFFPTDDRKSVLVELEENHGHVDFILNRKPRFRD